MPPPMRAERRRLGAPAARDGPPPRAALASGASAPRLLMDSLMWGPSAAHRWVCDPRSSIFGRRDGVVKRDVKGGVLGKTPHSTPLDDTLLTTHPMCILASPVEQTLPPHTHIQQLWDSGPPYLDRFLESIAAVAASPRLGSPAAFLFFCLSAIATGHTLLEEGGPRACM